MSRVANIPVVIPRGVTVSRSGNLISISGSKGSLTSMLHPGVELVITENEIKASPGNADPISGCQAGTARAIINNMVVGVSVGYERKLSLVGVGYRASVKEGVLNLSLGFSHPVEFIPPAGVVIESPTQTEILVKGCDKQAVGQVSANIMSFRPPEPYKGKGVRYSDEVIIKKETKKK